MPGGVFRRVLQGLANHVNQCNRYKHFQVVFRCCPIKLLYPEQLKGLGHDVQAGNMLIFFVTLLHILL